MSTPFEQQDELKKSILAAKQAADSADSAKRESALSNPNIDAETKSAIASGVPMQSREEAMRKTLDYQIPVQAVVLPSGGALYDANHPCHNMASLEVRAMTANEENIVMNSVFVRKGTMVNELIKACLLNKHIDPSDLLAGDQAALMYGVRSLGYGNIYEPKHKCPQCEVTNVMEIDLDQFPVRTLSIQPNYPGENAFTFVLPVTKKKVVFKFLNATETKAIVDEIETKRKKGIQSSNLITARLMANIVSIEGETNKTKIASFTQYMPAKDSLALRKYIDEHEPIVDTKVNFKCMSCGHEDDMNTPMTAEFFWPNATD